MRRLAENGDARNKYAWQSKLCVKIFIVKRRPVVGCLHHKELLEGAMNFNMLPEYFGNSFDREFAEKLVIEAFEEDTGSKVGFGVAEKYEEEDQDQVGVLGKTESKDGDGKLGKAEDKEDREEED
ncbi:hypothetical protein THAOC_23349 [Thalassiosira oceanica]|uniref:Uncharacterized protein n=1 Tax=Thalassiosira oceanica TaxID=159749 RepID=K0SDM9_THAOC|nr:hypothetical protein THAOC_23349 [Thalassiosira oceanica]|eukprot:EJK56712.1 hypothetical protein THAOC_23349 [Thalassiosira oceanica]